jgi:hypothetical protein
VGTPVDAVIDSATEGEAVGPLRHCKVTLAGTSGRMFEFVPIRRVAYVVDDESLGVHKVFDDYGFAITFERV